MSSKDSCKSKKEHATTINKSVGASISAVDHECHRIVEIKPLELNISAITHKRDDSSLMALG